MNFQIDAVVVKLGPHFAAGVNLQFMYKIQFRETPTHEFVQNKSDPSGLRALLLVICQWTPRLERVRLKKNSDLAQEIEKSKEIKR